MPLGPEETPVDPRPRRFVPSPAEADRDEVVRIERNVWLPAAPATVWRHLLDGGLVSTWFDAEVVLEPRRGGRITLRAGDGDLRWGTVEVIEAGRWLQWTWRTDEGEPSLVRIGIADEDGGTRLSVTEMLIPYESSFHPLIEGRGGTWLPRVAWLP